MVEFVLLFHNGSRDSIMAAGGTITATHETLLWQRERLYNGGKGGSIIAAENQERPPRNCIAAACETSSWQQENAIIAADSILQGEVESMQSFPGSWSVVMS